MACRTNSGDRWNGYSALFPSHLLQDLSLKVFTQLFVSCFRRALASCITLTMSLSLYKQFLHIVCSVKIKLMHYALFSENHC